MKEQGNASACTAEIKLRPKRRHRFGRFVLSMVLFLLAVGAAYATANENTEPEAPGAPTTTAVAQAIEAEDSAAPGKALTDPEVAEDLPHHDLGREEAAELLSGVFEPELQAPAGIYDELEVEKLLAPNVAVIASGSPPTPARAEPLEASVVQEVPEPEPPQSLKEELRAGWPAAEEARAQAPSSPEGEMGQLDGAMLVESTVPLGTETPSGSTQPVDLSLEADGEALRPANPLVEVAIPQSLGDGVQLPETGVGIELVGGPGERSPSVLGQSVGLYPNVAPDTDLAVAPTLTGVETLTHIRSAEAPHSETLRLDLPAGAELVAAESGGASVRRGGEELVGIAPPSALDAAGTPVPVSLSISGDSLTLTVEPDSEAQFPILLDPLFQTYEWRSKNTQAGIYNTTGHEGWSPEQFHQKGLSSAATLSSHVFNTWVPLQGGDPGLNVQGGAEWTVGDHANWIYTVPRYFQESPKPTSYVSHLTLSSLVWLAASFFPSPYVFAGIWDPTAKAWVSSYSHESLEGHSVTDMSAQYQFPNENAQHEPNTNAKMASVGLYATETHPNGGGEIYVGNATVELGDKDVPQQPIANGPSNWVNQAVTPLTFTAADTGLGVYAIGAATEQLDSEGKPLHSWKASYGCIGGAESACPRTWKSSDAGHPALNVEPALLPNGLNFLNVVAEDPVGNKSPASSALIKVDHTAPQIALSGSAIEQATLGTKRPTYTLKAEATDGTSAAPQSGVKWEEIDFHGEVLALSEPGCSTQNCAIPLEGKIEASKYPAGTYTATITAMDMVGLVTTKQVSITLNPSAPTVALSGTMTEQKALGATRPRYKLKVSAESLAGAEGVLGPPAYLTSFGSSGTANGQLAHPGDIAQDSKGNLWAVDVGNNRIEEFTEAGEFLKTFGSMGAGSGQFNRPTAIAIDPKGDLWIIDAGNHRVQEFNEKGEFLKAFGSSGTGNGQLSAAEGIAIDTKGNVYVADTYNARIEKFSEAGEFLKTIGTKGSGTGQLVEPTGIEVGPGGNVWVTDWANNKVVVFNEAGEFVRQFGSEGTGNGQFNRPDAIAIDSRGDVWVGDQNNERVQEFNLAGEYLAKFGAAGSGNGQFSFGFPMGIAINTKGEIWVTDTGHNRVQKWSIPNYVPAYSSAFGTLGSANGQFSHPADVAIDAKGNLWIADENNNRLQEFNQAGEFLKSLGSAGAGNGQFVRPKSIAFDAKGDIWVADSGNNRLEEFSESGSFLKAVGSSGAGNGQFSGPEGIAIDPRGNLWVSDTYNFRIQELNEKGEFLKVVNPTGMGPIEPTGIDVGPGGNVWVADWAHNRVIELSEGGALLRSFGTAGAGNGQFSNPDAITVDRWGSVWVGDQSNNRVQAFNQDGEYIAQFGAAGSGNGQFSFSYPFGIAADNKGNLWIADPANNRIHKWSQPNLSSEVTTEITFDGTKVESGNASCSGEHCPVVREWTLESSSKTPEGHTVVVKASDGLGNTTTKTLPIQIERDKTKPTIQLSGQLWNAPEGWVEQEHPYTFNAIATDAGYGVTQVKLTIDGSMVAQTGTTTCPEGGCEKLLSNPVDPANLTGGAHTATVTATDGAGNASTKSWTVNVDPEGHISTAEVEDTLEAAEDTGSVNTVGPPEEEAAYEGTEAGLGVDDSGGKIVATGTVVPAEIASDPKGGATLQIPEPLAFGDHCEGPEDEAPSVEAEEPAEAEGLPCEAAYQEAHPTGGEEVNYENLEPIELAPTGVENGAGAAKAVNGVSTVSANTSSHADTIVRPLYDGLMTFQDIRDEAAPTEYTWEVRLEPGQQLKQLDPQHAEVYYQGGHPAFGIEAEPAHDAVGTSVPTTITVSGTNLVTLGVNHRQGAYVYPVIAGAGWQGGFAQVLVQGPKDERELQEEREELEREEREKLEGTWEESSELERAFPEHNGVAIHLFSAPIETTGNAGSQELSGSSASYKTRKFKFTYCKPHEVPNSNGVSPVIPGWETTAEYLNRGKNLPRIVSECSNPDLEGIYWRTDAFGIYHYIPHKWVWVKPTEFNCVPGGEKDERPARVHCLEIRYESGHGRLNATRLPIEIRGEWRFHPGKGQWGFKGTIAVCFEEGGELFPHAGTQGNEAVGRNPTIRPMIWEYSTAYVEESCSWH